MRSTGSVEQSGSVRLDCFIKLFFLELSFACSYVVLLGLIYDVIGWSSCVTATVLYCIVTTFYSPSCLGQETAKRELSVFESSCHLPTCLPHTVEASHTVPFIAECQARKKVKTNFYSLWFDPTGNRTRIYSFSCRRLYPLDSSFLQLVSKEL